MPNFESIRQFLVTELPKKNGKTTYDKIVIAIYGSSRPSTKLKIPPLDLPSKTKSDRYQFCLKRPTSKFDLV